MPQPAFEQRFAAAWNPSDWLGVPVVVAVSGGGDSVALACAMAALRGHIAEPRQPLVLAHLNHGLRGNAAEEDARFVARLADDLGLPCELGRVDLPALAQQAGDGLEAAARAARYAFFEQVAERYSARYVATAHTRDDQVETILHRIVRGTGLRGLAGMPRARSLNSAVTLIRPLLAVRRDELRAYLQAIQQAFRHDATNDDARFTRNRLRNELLPLLRRDYNERVDEALWRLGEMSSEAGELVERQLADWRQTLEIEVTGNTVSLTCDALRRQSPYLVRELLRLLWQEQGWPEQAMGHAQWEALARLALSEEADTQTLPGGIRAQKKGGQLVLTRPSVD
ncbi:MAG: tRNA lysidine(34) synthetase TilS [Pirellulales bacterium]